MRAAAFLILCASALTAQDSPFSRKKGPGGEAKPKEPPAAPAPRESPSKPPRTKAAVDSAIRFLLAQQAADGSFSNNFSGLNGHVVSTAYGGLALLASGQHPGPAARAAQFVRDSIPKLLQMPTKPDSQSNWGVMAGTSFLAEYFAVTKDASLKDPLQSFVATVLKRMEPSGGFNHEPGIPCPLNYREMAIMSNLALTGVLIAKKEGLKVEEPALLRGIQYIRECATGGGVGYAARPQEVGQKEPGRTGGAIWIFAMQGLTQDPVFGSMVQYWRGHIKDSTNGHGSIVLGTLGAAMGARALGSADWDQFVAQIFPKLLEHQDPDGSFREIKGTGFGAIGRDGPAGAVYRTTLCALVLQLDSGHLKFFAAPTKVK